MTEAKITIQLIRDTFGPGMNGASAFMDGRFVVLINDRLNEEEQEQAFLHEMLHVYRQDHFSTASVQALEAGADGTLSCH